MQLILKSFLKICEFIENLLEYIERRINYSKYKSFSHSYPNLKAELMNFGYAEISDDGKIEISLLPEEKLEAFQIQIYHQIYHLGIYSKLKKSKSH